MSPYNTPPHIPEEEEEEEVYLPEGEPVEIVEDPSDGDVEMMSDNEESPVFTPEVDDAKLVLAEHEESVFCVDIHPSGKFLVSGSQDNRAIVWDVETSAVIFTCTGHEDSVTNVAFSPGDGHFLATGDMAGGVQIWRVEVAPDSTNVTIALHRSLQMGELLCLLWWQMPPSQSTNNRPRPLVLFTGCEDGTVSATLVTVSAKSSERPPKYLTGSGSAAVGVTIVPSTFATERPYLAVICRDGDFRVWDLKNEQALLQANLPNPRQSVELDEEEESTTGYLSIAAPQPQLPSNPNSVDLVAVAGFEKIVLVPCKPPPLEEVENGPKKINPNTLVVISLEGALSVETMEFCPTHPFLAFGTVAGQIGVYDISCARMRQLWSCVDPSSGYEEAFGVTALKWSHCNPLVFFTSTLAASVVAWNASTGGGVPLAIWRGHSAAVLDFALAPPTPESSIEAFIVSASDDCSVRVYDTERLNSTNTRSE
ncbi:hypothetical protein Aperf_G00000123659 [Anoplocephala perfoliata]